MKTAGVGDAIVQAIVGHDSAESSEHYTHMDAASKRAALAKLPDLTEPATPEQRAAWLSRLRV